MKHIRRQAALSALIACLVVVLMVSIMFDAIEIAVLGLEHSSLKLTGQLAIAILSTSLLKYVIDASPLYRALSRDISNGTLEVKSRGDHYISLRAKGVDTINTIEISACHHGLSEIDLFGAVVRYSYAGDILPIGSFGAFLLLLKARKVARRESSKQVPISEHVKRWRGGNV